LEFNQSEGRKSNSSLVNFALIGQNPIQSQSQSLVWYGLNSALPECIHGDHGRTYRSGNTGGGGIALISITYSSHSCHWWWCAAVMSVWIVSDAIRLF